jgi:ferredoxin
MTIYYFSGTGNSLKAARDIAEKCGGSVASMRALANVEAKEDAIGFTFPVYFGGVPNAVAELIRNSRFDADYFFAVVTYGGTAGTALEQVASLLSDKGLRLDYGVGVWAYPNYIAMYSFPFNPKKTAAKQDKKMAVIAEAVNHRTRNEIATKPVTVKSVAEMDTAFTVSPDCIGCGQCAKLCPAGNIEIADGKPLFLHKCEQCMACIQWCPKSAINTPKTLKRNRYHNPNVTVEDLMQAQQITRGHTQ